jgi:hypothetical protein
VGGKFETKEEPVSCCVCVCTAASQSPVLAPATLITLDICVSVCVKIGPIYFFV